MATDKPKIKARRVKARRTTGRAAGISQSAFAGYGHQQPAPPQTTTADPEQSGAATDSAATPADSTNSQSKKTKKQAKGTEGESS